MRIVLDAMGADNAPDEIIRGGLLFARTAVADLIIAGERQYRPPDLSEYPNVTYVETRGVIGMEDAPVEAVKTKPDSSVVTGIRLLKEGKAEAFVSAANSGAIMAAALLKLGRLGDISRPAIAVMLPTMKMPVLVVDAGANMDCKPRNLLDFAVMGHVFYKNMMDVEMPRIGLLNIGEEPNKGNETALQSYRLLKANLTGFCGNVEGSDLPEGRVHVAVCDGFVGNIVLKLSEGIAAFIINTIKQSIRTGLLRKAAFALFLRGTVRDMKKKIDYDEYGGAPLLGVDGNVIICHGKSSAKAICNALRVAARLVDKKINEKIKNEIMLHKKPGDTNDN